MKPMLAATIENTATIPYPVAVSAKLDGVRCLIINGVAMSRSLKPIPNAHVQFLFGRTEYNGYDGELIVGEPNAHDAYRTTSSGVMSKDGAPDVFFYVFDRWDCPELTWSSRFSKVEDSRRVIKHEHRLVFDESSLLELEQRLLAEGFEGCMVRKQDMGYKHGRSTLREFGLAKLKRFTDSEFKVVGFVERMHNANDAVTNALGHTERSSHKENLIGRGDLGALVLEMEDGQKFNCGTGFDDAQRAEIWKNQDAYLNKWAKVKHFQVGVKDKCRFPVFLGFRADEDMLAAISIY